MAAKKGQKKKPAKKAKKKPAKKTPKERTEEVVAGLPDNKLEKALETCQATVDAQEAEIAKLKQAVIESLELMQRTEKEKRELQEEVIYWTRKYRRLVDAIEELEKRKGAHDKGTRSSKVI